MPCEQFSDDHRFLSNELRGWAALEAKSPTMAADLREQAIDTGRTNPSWSAGAFGSVACKLIAWGYQAIWPS